MFCRVIRFIILFSRLVIFVISSSIFQRVVALHRGARSRVHDGGWRLGVFNLRVIFRFFFVSTDNNNLKTNGKCCFSLLKVLLCTSLSSIPFMIYTIRSVLNLSWKLARNCSKCHLPMSKFTHAVQIPIRVRCSSCITCS